MFYCAKCKALTQPNEPMTKIVTEKYDNGNIKKEIGICTKCAGIVWPVPVLIEGDWKPANEEQIMGRLNRHNDRVQAI